MGSRTWRGGKTGKRMNRQWRKYYAGEGPPPMKAKHPALGQTRQFTEAKLIRQRLRDLSERLKID